MNRRAVKAAVQILISAAALTLVLLHADVRKVAALLRGANPAWLAVAALLCVFDRWVMAFKWRLLLTARGMDCSLSRAFRLYYASSFIGAFLPFGVAGDLARGAWMFRDGHRGSDAASSIMIERILGIASSACTAAACAGLLRLFLGVNVIPLLAFSAALLAGVAVALAAAFTPGLTARAAGHPSAPLRWLASLHASLAAYRHHAPTLAAFFVWTLLEQLLPPAVHILAARAMGLTVPATIFFLTVPMAQMVARMPMSYNGIGIMEGVLAYTFIAIGLPKSEAVGVALLSEVVVMLSLLPAIPLLRSSAHPPSSPGGTPASA